MWVGPLAHGQHSTLKELNKKSKTCKACDFNIQSPYGSDTADRLPS